MLKMPIVLPFETQKKTGFLLSFIIIFLISSSLSADKVTQPIHAKKLVPACLLDWNSGPEYAVLVDKSRQKVFVYKRDDLYNPYKVYDCSTGENEGRKEKRNDRKTPEGIYYFIKSFEDKYLSPIYGTKALTLDYPNIIDKRNGRGGYGIWFHGTNKNLAPKDTNGCVAMENRDIEALSNIISLFDTPVIISSKIELVPENQNEDQKRNIADIIESWRSSWEGKDIDKYMSFYSNKFKSGWKDWGQWKTYKKQLAKKYSRIEVDISDLNLFSHDGVIIASFEQDYRTPNFESLGTKKIYLAQNSIEWKIIEETFSGYDKARIAKKSSDFSKQGINDFLFTWKDAWENKDISGYILCYDNNFKSRGMDLDAWELHRRRLNDKYDTINVEISNVKIQSLAAGKKARVSFIQRYKADRYRDKGKKKILLVRKDKDWKIMEENWTRIR